MATLLSLNVGIPKDVSWRGRTVHTGVWKSPVDGPRMVRRLNIDGDGQGDLAGHGGEQRAVLVYQVESYGHWAEFLGRDDLERGAFGENFTVEGLADDEVCIGDRLRIGEAEFEVTQPRVTCFRVGMRMGEPRLPSLLVAHHRPGFYLRVLTEGHVGAGDEIVRTARGPHAMSVAEVDALLYLPGHDEERLRAALDIPALSPGWQQSFRSMLEGGGPQPAGVTVAPPPAWVGFRTLTVIDVVAESDTVTSFRMSADEALPAYLPGQFLTLRVPGAGDPAPVRTYSLSGDPAGGSYRISVKGEALGLVSAYLHAHLQHGDRIEVAAPRGDFVLTEGSGPVLLVSAGVGVTPLLSMLHRLADETSARVRKSKAIVYSTILGYTGAAETYLELADRASKITRDELLGCARQSLRDLRRFQLFFPFARPAYLRYRAQLHALEGHRMRARGDFERAIALSRKLAMPYDEAQASWLAGRYIDPRHTAHAAWIFERLGCQWHLEQTKRAR